MTKDNSILPLTTAMNADKVSSTKRMWWQGYEEVDVIAPCKEKLQKLLSCCQDVAQIVETLETHMQRETRKEASPLREVDGTKMEIILLRDELHRSKLHSEKLEVANMSLERKIAEMEEKVQALTAQLMVYKEDFDLERRDRENAQGRLIESEQQLLMYQRLYGPHQRWSTLEPCAVNTPHFEQQSPGSHRHQRYYPSTELLARGRDVCDCFQTDGVEEDDRERPALARTVKLTENAVGQDLDFDCCSSVQLKAQSFNFRDFFPVTANTNESVIAVSARPLDVSHKALVDDGGDATERRTLCADGAEELLPCTGVLASGKPQAFADPFKTDLSRVDSYGRSVVSPLGKQQVRQDKLLQDSSPAVSWSFLSKDEAETSLGNLNLYETDSPHLSTENVLQDSNLQCPKCRMSFLQNDHLLLLDHLEEC